MRICIDISQGVYEGTGSGRYVIELVRGLLELDRENEYLLFGSAMRRRSGLQSLANDFKTDFKQSLVNTKLFPFPPKFYEVLWNSLHILPLESFTGPVDIYHSSDWAEASSKAKRVTTVHDLIPFLYPDYVHPRIREAHTKRWKRIKQEVDRIIVDAEVTKNDIIKLFDVNPEKIIVIPLACDQRFFSVGKQIVDGIDISTDAHGTALLHKYGLHSRSYILAVGTLEPRKNIARLIEAYNLLDSETRSQYPLVIVGKKSWDSEFKHAKNVHFTGYVEDVELPYLYGMSLCFVMPSLYEGFGLPVLEAMASGTPVICSHTSSLPEIGGDDVHYIENPEDTESIRMILAHVLGSDKTELTKLAQSAFQRAQKFSWKRTATETLAVYNTLFKER